MIAGCWEPLPVLQRWPVWRSACAVDRAGTGAEPVTRSRNRRSSQTSKGARTGIIPHHIINAQAACRGRHGSHGQPRPRLC